MADSAILNVRASNSPVEYERKAIAGFLDCRAGSWRFHGRPCFGVDVGIGAPPAGVGA
jgi:hypothetical protein